MPRCLPLTSRAPAQRRPRSQPRLEPMRWPWRLRWAVAQRRLAEVPAFARTLAFPYSELLEKSAFGDHGLASEIAANTRDRLIETGSRFFGGGFAKVLGYRYGSCFERHFI